MTISKKKLETLHDDLQTIFREMEEIIGIAKGVAPDNFYTMDELGEKAIIMREAEFFTNLGADAYERFYYVLRDFGIELSK